MKRALGTLRIIGGEWRSRRIEFDADPAIGLRATPDRVRQTLFDWLSPLITGAECLDLFAGAGGLGLEALSRGAKSCTFVDNGGPQIAHLRAAIDKLGARARAELMQADALRWLPSAGRYDMVFLDPPFRAGLLAPVLAQLAPHLKPANRVFLEWSGPAPVLPEGFRWLKEKQAGQVSYGLATFEPPST